MAGRFTLKCHLFQHQRTHITHQFPSLCCILHYWPYATKVYILERYLINVNIMTNVLLIKNSLIYHQSLHTAEKPYQCEYYDKCLTDACITEDYVIITLIGLVFSKD